MQVTDIFHILTMIDLTRPDKPYVLQMNTTADDFYMILQQLFPSPSSTPPPTFPLQLLQVKVQSPELLGLIEDLKLRVEELRHKVSPLRSFVLKVMSASGTLVVQQLRSEH